MLMWCLWRICVAVKQFWLQTNRTRLLSERWVYISSCSDGKSDQEEWKELKQDEEKVVVREGDRDIEDQCLIDRSWECGGLKNFRKDLRRESLNQTRFLREEEERLDMIPLAESSGLSNYQRSACGYQVWPRKKGNYLMMMIMPDKWSSYCLQQQFAMKYAPKDLVERILAQNEEWDATCPFENVNVTQDCDWCRALKVSCCSRCFVVNASFLSAGEMSLYKHLQQQHLLERYHWESNNLHQWERDRRAGSGWRGCQEAWVPLHLRFWDVEWFETIFLVSLTSQYQGVFDGPW